MCVVQYMQKARRHLERAQQLLNSGPTLRFGGKNDMHSDAEIASILNDMYAKVDWHQKGFVDQAQGQSMRLHTFKVLIILFCKQKQKQSCTSSGICEIIGSVPLSVVTLKSLLDVADIHQDLITEEHRSGFGVLNFIAFTPLMPYQKAALGISMTDNTSNPVTSANAFWHFDNNKYLSMFYTVCIPQTKHCFTKICNLAKVPTTLPELNLPVDGIHESGRLQNVEEINRLDKLCVQPKSEEVHILDLGRKKIQQQQNLHRGPRDDELSGVHMRLLITIDEGEQDAFETIWNAYMPLFEKHMHHLF